jgi:hypothetical protein
MAASRSEQTVSSIVARLFGVVGVGFFIAAAWNSVDAEEPRVERKVQPKVVDFTRLLKQKSEARRLSVDAEEPRVERKVQPKVVDFTRLLKQKSEARRLMDLARESAKAGDLATARRHAERAAAIPIEWNLGETTPEMVLEDLNDGLLDTANATEVSEPRRRMYDAADVIELPAKPPVQKTKSLEKIGLKPMPSASDASKEVEVLPAPAAPSMEQTHVSHPRRSLEELSSADANPGNLAPQTNETDTSAVTQSGDHIVTSEPPEFEAVNPQALRLSQSKGGTTDLQKNLASLKQSDLSEVDGTIPHEKTTSADVATASAVFAAPTHVVHEFRISDHTPVTETKAKSQIVNDLNGLLLAGLFGSLIVLVVIVSVATLRWFGSNPALSFKVDMNGPIALPMATPLTAPVAQSVVRETEPEVQTFPIAAFRETQSSMKSSYGLDDLGIDLHSEDTMLKQVLEDNLKLRADLSNFEDTRIAA